MTSEQTERHKFQNRLRILRSIDGVEVEDLSTPSEVKFLIDPYEFFIRCSDQDAEVIFKALLRREK